MEAGRIKVKKTLKSHKTKQHGLTKEQNANEDAFAEKTCKQVLCSQIVDPLLFLKGRMRAQRLTRAERTKKIKIQNREINENFNAAKNRSKHYDDVVVYRRSRSRVRLFGCADETWSPVDLS